jgi:hypothetical protein
VFIGSTNSDAYLTDETGGRRFWPVAVGHVDIDALRQDVGQLWAEAVAAYQAGEQWWLDKELEAAAREEQEGRRIEDPWEPPVCTYLAGLVETSVHDVLEHAIGMPKDRHDQAGRNRIARILRANNWERVRARRNGSLVWIYRLGDDGGATGTGNVPTPDAPSGNGKPSNPGHVPSVPSKPADTCAHACAHARYGGFKSKGEQVGTLGTSRMRRAGNYDNCLSCNECLKLDEQGLCADCTKDARGVDLGDDIPF